MTHLHSIAAARARMGDRVFNGAPEPGRVYRLHRDHGLTPVAVFTGEQTPSGRYRFEPVDRKIGESSRFACKPEAVLAELAPTLADYIRARKGRTP